jgi:predicted RNase H-like HicB family nuclease
MKCVYPACFYKEEGGRYSVIMPDFPLATFGDDIVDAMYMASDAAAGRILVTLEEGEALPLPSPMGEVELEKPGGFVSLVYINTDSVLQAAR